MLNTTSPATGSVLLLQMTSPPRWNATRCLGRFSNSNRWESLNNAYFKSRRFRFMYVTGPLARELSQCTIQNVHGWSVRFPTGEMRPERFPLSLCAPKYKRQAQTLTCSQPKWPLTVVVLLLEKPCHWPIPFQTSPVRPTIRPL